MCREPILQHAQLGVAEDACLSLRACLSFRLWKPLISCMIFPDCYNQTLATSLASAVSCATLPPLTRNAKTPGDPMGTRQPAPLGTLCTYILELEWSEMKRLALALLALSSSSWPPIDEAVQSAQRLRPKWKWYEGTHAKGLRLSWPKCYLPCHPEGPWPCKHSANLLMWFSRL